ERPIMVEDKGARHPTELRRIELAEEGVLEGVVVDGRGDPIPGVRVAKDAVPTYVPVGVTLPGVAVTDARGRFRLGELPDGLVTLEAHAADVGRVRKPDVRVRAGRTIEGVKLVLTRTPSEPTAKEPLATGGVAVTLGETPAGLEAAEIVVVSVAEGSEA